MRLVIDIAEGMIDQWGALVVELVPRNENGEYTAPKITAPGFKYRIPEDPGMSTFRAVVGPIPEPRPQPAKEVVPPLEKTGEEVVKEAEGAVADAETAVAEPSEEEKGGDVIDGDDKLPFDGKDVTIEPDGSVVPEENGGEVIEDGEK